MTPPARTPPARPKLLDLYCGVGGASVGYDRAGFDVTGVDIAAMPNYPFTFHRADALTFPTAGYDAIHASPPCQASAPLTQGTNHGRVYPQLIPATRALLHASGVPWVLENVVGADIRADLILCGEMFGIAVIRHRLFESNIALPQPPHVPHRGRVAGMRHGVWYTGPYYAVYGKGGGKGSVAQWRTAMDIDWTWTRREIAESIPPVYTEFVGTHLIRHLEAQHDAT